VQEMPLPSTSSHYCFGIILIGWFWLKAQRKSGLMTQHYSVTHQSAIAELIWPWLCTSTREKERAGLPCSHDSVSL